MTLALLAPALLLAAAPDVPPDVAVPAAPMVTLAEPSQPPAAAPTSQQPAPAARELADPLDDPASAAPPPAVPSASQPAAPSAPAGAKGHTPGDPYESLNRDIFSAHEKADRAILRPAAMGYKHVVPEILRDGIRNILLLLTEPIVFLNELLQLRPEHALRTLARTAINVTMGWGGLFDVAKRPYFNLPHEANGFGDTLGYYGVKPGAYLFLPFIGPTSVRDLIGGAADGLVMPFAVGKPFNRRAYQIPVGVIGGLDRRAESDQDLKTLFATAVDPYATLRSVYLQDRDGEIAALHGHKPAAPSPADTDLIDPEEKTTGPASGTPELKDPMTDPAAPPPSR